MSSLLQHTHSAIQSTLDTFKGLYSTQGPDDGYRVIPSYGGTLDSLDQADPTGQQRLGADPTKIEPKVWLASERTFLNWLRVTTSPSPCLSGARLTAPFEPQVALLISSFGLALFNASVGVKDAVGQTMGIIYTVLAIGMVGYAYRMQQRRRHRIIYRFAGHHGQHSPHAQRVARASRLTALGLQMTCLARCLCAS